MDDSSARFELSAHALKMAQERNISVEWIQKALEKPQKVYLDQERQVKHYYLKVEKYGNRVLDVIVNTGIEPWRVVTVFFNRGMKGKL